MLIPCKENAVDYQHNQPYSHWDVQQSIRPLGILAIRDAILQGCGVAQAKQTHQPQEQHRLHVVGYRVAIRVDESLDHENSNGENERNHLVGTHRIKVSIILHRQSLMS